MRYTALKGAKVKTFSPELPKGTNLQNDGRCGGCSELCDGVNIWRENGRIATRPAVVYRQNSAIQFETYEYISRGMTVTDNTACFGGIVYRIAYTVTEDFQSFQKYNIYLLGCSGDVTPIGSINFNRVDALTFYKAVSCMFFQGKPTSGCGIYAFFRQRDKDDIYTVYELDTDLAQWNGVYTFYEPVVYINGRGTRYSEAAAAGTAYGASPESPEALNMLSGGFKAFYSSDGYSSVFKLPISQLDDVMVSCKMYTAPTNCVEWKIMGDAVTAEATVNSQKVIMGCDRVHGIVYFYNDSGSFSLPVATEYGPNNIMITAAKKNGNLSAKVLGCTACRVCGSRLLVYGNPEYPAEIYTARLENPLYFSETACAVVGDISDTVTRLENRGGDLAVFKSKAIYELDIKDGGYYKTDIPLGESGADFDGLFAADKITVRPVCLNMGCDRPETLCEVSGNIIWQAGDNGVYALEKGKNTPVEISASIRAALSHNANSLLKGKIASAHRGVYFLFGNDGRVFVFDLRGKQGAAADITAGGWYIWKLPSAVKIWGAYADADRMILCCSDEKSKVCYMANFSDGNDRLLYYDTAGVSETEYNINSSFSLACYPEICPERLKSIEKIYVTFECNGKVTLLCEDRGECCTTLLSDGQLKTACVAPKMRNCEGVKLTFSAQSPFSVAGIVIKYRDLPCVKWAAT